MKKIILTIVLCIGALQFSNAQFSYGLKGGLNFASLSDVVDLDEGVQPKQEVDANTSWHAGVWCRIKVPVLGLYVRPEAIYTSISSSIPLPAKAGEYISSDYQLNRADFPILVGLKMLGVANIFAGPVFQYVLSSELDVADIDIEAIELDDFMVGMQVGFGLEFWKLGLDVRYETDFSTNTTDFAPSKDPSAYTSIDDSPDQFMVGLSYKF